MNVGYWRDIAFRLHTAHRDHDRDALVALADKVRNDAAAAHHDDRLQRLADDIDRYAQQTDHTERSTP